MSATVCIRIDYLTRNRLTALAKPGDTFSEILTMLLYEHEILSAIKREYPDIIQAAAGPAPSF